MKRHLQLQSLSRQHHNGLLIALLLSKGIKKKADRLEMASFIAHNWETELKQHFHQEEVVLLPVLIRKNFDAALIEKLIAEHRMLSGLAHDALTGTIELPQIEFFASLLTEHIRFEERQFFPAVEKLLSDEEMEDIGELLKETDEKNCMQYPIRFWE